MIYACFLSSQLNAIKIHILTGIRLSFLLCWNGSMQSGTMVLSCIKLGLRVARLCLLRRVLSLCNRVSLVSGSVRAIAFDLARRASPASPQQRPSVGDGVSQVPFDYRKGKSPPPIPPSGWLFVLCNWWNCCSGTLLGICCIPKLDPLPCRKGGLLTPPLLGSKPSPPSNSLLKSCRPPPPTPSPKLPIFDGNVLRILGPCRSGKDAYSGNSIGEEMIGGLK